MEKQASSLVEEEDEETIMIKNLPRERDSVAKMVTHCLYQGFWVPEFLIRAVLASQKHFVALDDDILLTSCPKSGTTWLKALSFSIVNRHRHNDDLSVNPLTVSNPHDLVLNLEYNIYDEKQSINVEVLPRPRLICTHVPYGSLPVSVKSSMCKIVYVWRDPMDQVVSLWHFCRALDPNENPSQEDDEAFFEAFCRGVHFFGPFWDHILGFWKASRENPGKVLFLRYEDLKNDASSQVKKLAEFIRFPFSKEEERHGVVEKICEMCSIENMKNYKGNIKGIRLSGASNASFFRKGVVGDWKNHISPSMAHKMHTLIQQKFECSGLKL